MDVIYVKIAERTQLSGTEAAGARRGDGGD